VVEQVPLERVEIAGLNEPVVLLVLHVTLPVGLEPVTVAVHVIGEFTGPGLGEQTIEVEERVSVDANAMETFTLVPLTRTLPLAGEAAKPVGPVTE
jgi:hypothetical protein